MLWKELFCKHVTYRVFVCVCMCLCVCVYVLTSCVSVSNDFPWLIRWLVEPCLRDLQMHTSNKRLAATGLLLHCAFVCKCAVLPALLPDVMLNTEYGAFFGWLAFKRSALHTLCGAISRNSKQFSIISWSHMNMWVKVCDATKWWPAHCCHSYLLLLLIS